jgi:SpoIIAA-like
MWSERRRVLSYKEMDNLAAVEIEISDRVSAEEFDATAKKLEAFIARHGRVRVLEIIYGLEGMDAKALWHDLKFSLRHVNDFSRCAIVSDAKFLSLWSTIAEPFIDCEVAYFPPDELEAARDWLLWPEGAADVI